MTEVLSAEPLSASTSTAASGRRPNNSLLWGLAVALSSVALLVPVHRLWKADLVIPFEYETNDINDTLFIAGMVKGVLDHGWYLHNENLGAPFGQDFADFPVGDNIHVLIMKGIGVLTSDLGVVLNVYFLLTFPLVALSAWWALGKLGVSHPVAAVVGLLYAFAPYHFWRAHVGHTFLAGYFVVPLAALLLLRVLGDEPLFEHRGGSGLDRLTGVATRRTLGTLLICVLIGSASSYYAAFTLVLLAMVTIVVAVHRRRIRSLVPGGALLAAITLTMVANVIPTFLYARQHGPNPAVARHLRTESEAYALKLTNLVLPMDHHRLPGLAQLTERYAKDYDPYERSQALGLIGVGGFVWLTFVGLQRLVRSGAPVGDDDRHSHLALLAFLAFAVGTVGGASSLISLLITSRVRAWNRLSIFIAFFCLAAVAILLDRLVAWCRSGVRQPGLGSAVLVTVLVVGLADQTTDAYIPDYPRVKTEYRNDEAFVTDIERSLPRGAMVYQLPYVPFPENPPVFRMVDYELLRGYLHSRSLRWSYGAFKGRPAADWQEKLVGQPMATVVPALACAGFEGIYVDRRAYADGGADIERQLEDILGPPTVVNRSRRMSFFSMTDYGRRLRATLGPRRVEAFREALLFAPRVTFGDGFYEEEKSEAGVWHWSQRESRLEVENPSDRALRVTLEMGLETVGRYPTSVRVQLPDGRAEYLPAVAGVTNRVRFVLPAGRSVIRLSSGATGLESVDPGRDERDLRFRVIDLTLSDDSLPDWRLVARVHPAP